MSRARARIRRRPAFLPVFRPSPRIKGFTDILAVSPSHHHSFLRTLCAPQCFDYRSPSPDFASQTHSAVALTKRGRLIIALGPIATRRSVALLGKLLASPAPARLVVLLPYKDDETIMNEGDSAVYFKTPPPWEEVLTVQNIEVVPNPIAIFWGGKDASSHENFMLVMLPLFLESDKTCVNRVNSTQEGSLSESINAGLDLLRNNKATSGDESWWICGRTLELRSGSEVCICSA